MSKNAKDIPNDAVSRFLAQEYARYNMTPQVIKIDNRTVIIPCFYIRNFLTIADAKENFIRGYFSRQYRDIKRYKEEGITPRKILFNGGTFVVPFNNRDSDKTDSEMVGEIMRAAHRDYRRAAVYTRKTNECGIGDERLTELGLDNIEAMSEAYNRYLVENAKEKAAAFAAFLAKGARSAFNGAKILLENSGGTRKVRLETRRFCDLAKKTVVGAALTTLTLGGGMYASQQLQSKQKEKDKTENFIRAENMPEDEDMAEFAGTEELWEEEEIVPETKEEAKPVEKAVETPKAKEHKKPVADVSKTGRLPEEIRKKYGLDDEKFQRFMGIIFKHEGGYRNVPWDYPTQMGITSVTLNSFWRNNKELARKLDFPTAKNIKNLNKEQCELIYKRDFYDHYRIGDFKNESIALLLFDIRVNHSSKTAAEIIANGIYQARGRKNVRSTDKILELANGISDKALNEQYFYDHMVKARVDFINRNHKKNGRKSNDYNGLMNRANKFKGKFTATNRQNKNSLRLAMNNVRGR